MFGIQDRRFQGVSGSLSIGEGDMPYGRPAPARLDPEVAELARLHENDPEAIIAIFRAVLTRRVL